MERISERILAQAGDTTLPHVSAETLEVTKDSPAERNPERTVEEDCPHEVIRDSRAERIPERTEEDIVDATCRRSRRKSSR